ncbi:MAG: CHAT domain-containing protein, partial [Kamptonema sp. SIO4C4]|nr:CHAT domain-containing protein [Kamptonema sp. SIO4C4]
QALHLVQRLNYPTAEANIFNSLGGVAHLQGNEAEALHYYQASLATAQAAGERYQEAIALGGLGLIYAQQKQYTEAIQYQEKSWQLAQQIGDRYLEGITLGNWGDTLRRQDNLPAAAEKLQQALDLFTSLRFNLEDAEKISLFDTQVLTYQKLQQVLVAQNRIETALEVAEAGRARAFVERLASTPIPPPSIADIRRIASMQKATIVQYSLIPDENYVSQGKQQGNPAYLYIWVVQPNGYIHFHATNLHQQGFDDFNNMIRTHRQALFSRNPQRRNQALQELYNLLIAPIAPQLPTDANSPVILVPQGLLFLLPFPAFITPAGDSLIEQHTLLTAPSIQTLELTQQHRQQITTEQALVVGNPTMPRLPLQDTPLIPLPGAEQEAIAIADLLQTAAIIGDRATEAAIREQITQARYIHLATHGLLQEIQDLGKAPGAIALTPTPDNDGFLTSPEIINLSLNAELVVLSACDTGRGTITGDGVVGLSRAFLAAGTASLVATLWKIPDTPTAVLMTEFYRQLQHTPNKAQALRHAMLHTKAIYPHPRDWAGFTLMGEQR